MSDTSGSDFIYEADVKIAGDSGAASLVFRSGDDPKNDGSYVANIDLAGAPPGFSPLVPVATIWVNTPCLTNPKGNFPCGLRLLEIA